MGTITWEDIDKAFDEAGMTKEDFAKQISYLGSKKFIKDQKELREYLTKKHSSKN